MNFRDVLIPLIVVVGFSWLLPRLMTARVLAQVPFRRLTMRRISPEDLDADETVLLRSQDEVLRAQGFEFVGFVRTQVMLWKTDACVAMAQWRHAVEPMWCAVQISLGPETAQPVSVALETRLATGERLQTMPATLRQVALPLIYDTEGHPDFTVPQLIERHRARIAAAGAAAIQIESDLDERLSREMAEVAQYMHRLREQGISTSTRDAAVDRPSVAWVIRGADALVRSARRRVATLRKIAVAPESSDALALRARADRVALAFHYDASLDPTENRFALRALFAISAALFWLIAALVFDPVFATLLIAVLALHEAGHAFMMTRFGYRDVSIFFIPMLGALATAKPAAISAIPRAIVLLAGPMPGIVLALLLLAVAPAWVHSHDGREILLLLVFLNGFNLLPFAPLDGGQVVQLIAGDHPYVTLAVQVLGAIGLLVVAWYLRSPVAGLMGGFLAWGLYSRRHYRRFYALAQQRLRGASSMPQCIEVVSQLATEPAYAKWRFAIRSVLVNGLHALSQHKRASATQRLVVLGMYGVSVYVAWRAITTLFGGM